MTTKTNDRCWCGRPLHYQDFRQRQRVEAICRRFGDFVTVRTNDGKRYSVQRHYIGLHGIKDKDLAALGFKETA